MEALSGVPTTTHSRPELREHPLTAIDLLTVTSVCSSKREAREMLASGSIILNGRKMQVSDIFTVANLLHDKVAAIRRGKKHWHVAVWE